uniref:Galectin n=1 Tax=Salvator merianae TaxID=96440 RepID=A0A8D0CGL6_SALMN
MEFSTDTGDFILQPPVFQPALPYVATIFGSLAPGKMVLMQGSVPLDAERFQVDFQVGCSLRPRADIGLHFNPRFRSRPHLICNSLRNGVWNEEQKSPHLPFKGGDPFQLLFLFEQDHVQVSVNKRHFLQYTLNRPLVQLNTLKVSGDVSVKMIAFLPNNPFESSRIGYPKIPQAFRSSPPQAAPLSCPLPDGLRPGDAIAVQGLVRHRAREFCIRLDKEPSRVAMRFHVCFLRRTVSWSSSLNEAQSSQGEVARCFPFHPQRYFELLFVRTEDHLKLALNGTPLGLLRLPAAANQGTTALAVTGDVLLYGAQVGASVLLV